MLLKTGQQLLLLLPPGDPEHQISLASESETLHSLAQGPADVTPNRSSAQPHVAEQATDSVKFREKEVHSAEGNERRALAVLTDILSEKSEQRCVCLPNRVGYYG